MRIEDFLHRITRIPKLNMHIDMPIFDFIKCDVGQNLKKIKTRKKKRFKEKKKLRKKGGEGLEICKSVFFH